MTQDWFSCYLYCCAVSLCSHIDIFWSKRGLQWPWFECNFPQQKKDVNSMRNYKYSKFEFRGWIWNLKPLSWCLKSLHLPNISKGMSCFTHIDIIVLTFARGNFVSNCNIIVCISKHPTVFSIWHTHMSPLAHSCVLSIMVVRWEVFVLEIAIPNRMYFGLPLYLLLLEYLNCNGTIMKTIFTIDV